LLDVIDQQLIKPGEYIFNRRKDFLISFLPLVKHLYLEIAQRQEDINLFFESELLQASFDELLQVTRQKDCIVQRTTSGIHRDNVEINLGSLPFRTIASQGQRKSLLFALKLAEMEVLKREKGFPPLLLLDDVFEKLDEERISNLLQKVCTENEGQIIITDTNEGRLKDHITQLKINFEILRL
jgi:DNA replication and repair protein RecF